MDDLGLAIQHLVNQLLAVDGVCDRLADIQDPEVFVVKVEVDVLPGRTRRVVRTNELLVRHLVQFGRTELGEGVLSDDIEFTGGQLCEDGVRVSHDLDNEIRRARGAKEERGHRREGDELPFGPFRHLVGADAKWLAHDVLLRKVSRPDLLEKWLQDMLRERRQVGLVVARVKDRTGLGSEVCVRLGRKPAPAIGRCRLRLVLRHEVRDHGVVVRRVDRRELLLRASVRNRVVRIHDQFPGELDIGGRDALAVRPLDILAHGEGHLKALVGPVTDVSCATVLKGRDRLCKPRHPVVQVIATRQGRFVPDRCLDDRDDVRIAKRITECRWFLGHAHHDCLARRLRPGDRCESGNKSQTCTGNRPGNRARPSQEAPPSQSSACFHRGPSLRPHPAVPCRWIALPSVRRTQLHGRLVDMRQA